MEVKEGLHVTGGGQKWLLRGGGRLDVSWPREGVAIVLAVRDDSNMVEDFFDS